jgi:hypothetical protein
MQINWINYYEKIVNVGWNLRFVITQVEWINYYEKIVNVGCNLRFVIMQGWLNKLLEVLTIMPHLTPWARVNQTWVGIYRRRVCFQTLPEFEVLSRVTRAKWKVSKILEGSQSRSLSCMKNWFWKVVRYKIVRSCWPVDWHLTASPPPVCHSG